MGGGPHYFVTRITLSTKNVQIFIFKFYMIQILIYNA